ncbi:MAG: DOMON-like domain-containing protein [Allosphingosinicella sp.]
MELCLIPHPDTPPESIRAVEVEILMTDGDDVLLRYFVYGEGLLLPPPSSSERVDDLWQTTCFELFLGSEEGEAYYEFNFSPSSQWAAYAFRGYRKGRRDFDLSVDPHIELESEAEEADRNPDLLLAAHVDLSELPAGLLRMGLSAVIEETGGCKSYWALAHPPGPPDFHHRDCFTLKLPAADRS